ncbi:classical arabinogalactan protein 4 [Stenotrophomonas sp. YIM B06876]|uniref:classical arabinogalactan protein 4 n=1 Tax=Stenotrophomonas sp. YIM B06876 TaxID=3060211 RepID=UPI002738916A|nr:classical arabinogalactan protein 4 [Stenotrophomonas sp. YIM B06876]
MHRSLHQIAGLLLVLLPVAGAAQIVPPTAPTATRPVGSRPALPSSPVNAGQVDDARLRDRLAEHPVSSTGVSTPQLPVKPVTPLRVYDARGRVLMGMKPAGPGRVLDTGSGRYYSTVPSGDGQRIVP